MRDDESTQFVVFVYKHESEIRIVGLTNRDIVKVLDGNLTI